MFNEIGNFLANSSSSFYLTIAIIGTAVFLIQTLMALTGAGDAHGIDTDISVGHEGMDHGWEGLHLFSIRGIVAFLTFFGWTGYIWGGLGWLGLLIAMFSGGVMMVVTAFIICGIMKLQHKGNVEAQDLVGCKGTVYLTVPGKRGGKGQVTVSLPGCTRTVNVLSDTELKTGTPIKVIEMIDGDLFIVEAL